MPLKGRVPFDSVDPRRSLLLDLYRTALAAVDGRRRMRAALAAAGTDGPVSAFAVGKAAAAMMQGAVDALGDAARARPRRRAGGRDTRRAARACGHRMPGSGRTRVPTSAASPRAARCSSSRSKRPRAAACCCSSRAVRRRSSKCRRRASVLRSLRALFDRSLSERFDIERLNRERVSLSRIKGGRLPGLFTNARIEAFMISDVPRDDPAVLASGLLDDPGVAPRLVGSLDDALDAASCVRRPRAASGQSAAANGSRATPRRRRAGSATSSRSAKRTSSFAAARRSCDCLRIPAAAGRCQHLAVAAAQCIAGHADYLLLAAGTDGRDGASEDAGAIVDGGTLERASDAGLRGGMLRSRRRDSGHAA